jgi:tetratricopeptide (TPR) repeat protein
VEATTSPWRAFFSRGTILSGVVAIAVAGLDYDVRVGPLVVLLLYAHEAGHVLAAHWRRVPVYKPPLFLPGFGAFVLIAPTANVWDEIFVSAGGPLFGSLVALILRLIGLNWNVAVLASAGGLALSFNLFNLVPILPFDGGRIVAKLGLSGIVLPLLIVLTAGAAYRFGTLPDLPTPLLFAVVFVAAPFGLFGHPDLLLCGLAALGVWSALARRRAVAGPSWPTRAGILGVYLLLGLFITAALAVPSWRTTAQVDGWERIAWLPVAWLPDADTRFLLLVAAGALWFAYKRRWSLLARLLQLAARIGVPTLPIVGRFRSTIGKARLLQNVGDLESSAKRRDLALTWYQVADATCDDLLRSASPDPAARWLRAYVLWRRGDLQSDMGRWAEAADAYRRAIGEYDALRDSPHARKARAWRARALENLGRVQVEQARRTAAADSFSRAIAAYDELLDGDPADGSARAGRESALGALAELSPESG